jgi:hypothetical protein
LDIKCFYLEDTVCGDIFKLKFSSNEPKCEIKLIGINDRCGIFKDICIDNTDIACHIKEKLLDRYTAFGWFNELCT